ncbi:Membrane protein involved in the export of O-antigen and teichoic acid [Granulicella rosea]|uniref:Membrane protein involved in the export of O-antigen and teichoic acid n=1 Tax=Granulicella rosea TaxID=474952 RepID=A0A239MMJ0_9BACT|nr:oligosaccharide flippase family protein [Granulicella rosea]SNT43324.1 Membrane protein involved in the export of O-antigen and teichoic acid [Granulicella rosea]
MIQKIKRSLANLTLKPFDTSTEDGRARERMRRVFLTSLASGVSKVISVGGTLVSVPFTLRYLGPELYGVWMVLVSIIGAMSFADLGIGNGLMNAVADASGKDDRVALEEAISSAFFLMLIIAGSLTLIGVVAYPFLPWPRLFNVRPDLAVQGAHAFVVLYAFFVANIPLGVILRIQSGLQQGYLSNIVAAAGSALGLILLFVVIVLHGSLSWLVFASSCGIVVATLINGYLLFREMPWLLPRWATYHGTTSRRLLQSGLMFFILQTAVALSYTSDNIVIAQVKGAAAVAVYSVPQKLFAVISMLISMVLLPLWPAYGEAASRGDVGWVRSTFLNSLKTAFTFSALAGTFFVLIGPWLLKHTVGREVHPSIALLIALAVWSVIASISSCFSMLLNGAGVLKVQSIVAIFVSLANLGLSIYFTRRFGIIGVCLGSILTQLIITLPIQSVLIRNLLRDMRIKTVAASS